MLSAEEAFPPRRRRSQFEDAVSFWQAAGWLGRNLVHDDAVRKVGDEIEIDGNTRRASENRRDNQGNAGAVRRCDATTGTGAF